MVLFTTKRSDIYKEDKEFDYVYMSVEKFAELVLQQVQHGDSITIQDFMYKFHCSIDTALEVLGYLYHEGIVRQCKGKYYVFLYDYSSKEAN